MTATAADRPPRLGNTREAYGAVAKTFHWTVALGILAMIPLGFLASRAAHSEALLAGDPDAVGRAVLLFSIHKTLGIVIFLAALGRIAWAVAQPRPAPLHPERRVETFAAGAVHWALYGALVLMPLSGWVAHAATEGFAPIRWPLGQDLPFVPESAAVAGAAGALHGAFAWVLIGALALHVAGALKHAAIDRDGTLGRMLPGRRPVAPVPDPSAGHGAAAPLAALGVYAVAIGVALAGSLGGTAERGAGVPQLAAPASVPAGWTVETGALGIAIRQFGSEIEGSFEDWSADIAFEEEAGPGGGHGEVEVQVDLASLRLGSVTEQAMGPDFLDVGNRPLAMVAGTIWRRADFAEGDGDPYVLRGQMTMRGVEVPVEMPFRLTMDGARASARGALTVDRRWFGVGEGFPDEGSLGFDVVIEWSLSAVRAAP